MARRGGHVGITQATEDAEVAVGWWRFIQDHVRCRHCYRLGGEEVPEVGGNGQGLDPIGRWKTRLEEERAEDVVD